MAMSISEKEDNELMRQVCYLARKVERHHVIGSGRVYCGMVIA
jgi:hypothetical protein